MSRRKTSWKKTIPLAMAAIGLVACASSPAPRPASITADATPTSRQQHWVSKTMEHLTLPEKAAQMVMVQILGRYENPESEDWKTKVALVSDLKVGGVILSTSDVYAGPQVLNALQAKAEIPLIVASDLERGAAFRFHQGTVPVPYAMAIGATRSEDAARFAGEITAREGRALGIHWALAPDADVNNNPDNPVINLRSFGERPDLVASMVAGFIKGVQGGGMLATAKHFPGHGDTAIDSHRAMPSLTVDRQRLEAVELKPFRSAIAADVASVMIGHLAVPALDPSGLPATLSPILDRQLLRDELGFKGIVVTDAMRMKGAGSFWIGAATVKAIQAGADVLLSPGDPRVAVQSIVRAVKEGELTQDRIDASVRRILEAKAELGLPWDRFVDVAALGSAVARPEDVRRADEIAAQGITLVRNRGDVLPLHAEQPLELLHLVLTSRPNDPTVRGIPEHEISTRRIPAVTFRLGPEITSATADTVIAAASKTTHILVSAYLPVSPRPDESELSPSQADLLARLAQAPQPLIVISYGSPYLLTELPEVDAYLCTFGAADSSQRAAIQAVFGEHAISGRLPVTLKGVAAFGDGIQQARQPMTLETAKPESVGFRPGTFQEVDTLLDDFVKKKAFPGGVVAVGKDGRLVHLHPFGHLTYAPDSPAVQPDTRYDLASMTKVIATTTMAMMLVDEGRLDLDEPVHDFLPRFTGPVKDHVTVRQLLTHSSGLNWWAPLYKDTRGKEDYVRKIEAMDLVYEPGTKSMYSDLGIILLGEILERVSGEPLDTFAREHIFDPLGMNHTLFKPPPAMRPSIAPTEIDPWRGRLIQGEVHDENAYAMGGVAPHAGLFSTAGDIARFAQMLINGGVFEHHRLVSRATVEMFTKRAGVPDSTRALGWDTRSAEGSSSGRYFSADAYGHTGFTGTSIWIDPERKLFLILLTNRVHPTRENHQIREARPAVADAVMRGLLEP